MALATIVSVRGSTYRRPGARLLVPEDGPSVGNLSGGCLEGEVEGVAREVMKRLSPRVEFYDLTADDEVVWGWGLGCNGAIEVFVEPAERAAEVAGALRAAVEEERALCAVTVLSSEIGGVEVGARVLVGPDGAVQGSLGDTRADRFAAAAAAAALASGVTEPVMLETPAGVFRAFVEPFLPPLRLLVCGAGHDAIPLVEQGAALGWRVVVVDDRDPMLNHQRFPGARAFVKAEPADVAAATAVDSRTYAVVMSHNYLRDRDYLRSLLGSAAAYIGMLGPKARLERLLTDLRGEGLEVSEGDLARLHGPAGLDLGAEGPEEIAVALVGEILAAARGRAGGYLRERSGPIHERSQPAALT